MNLLTEKEYLQIGNNLRHYRIKNKLSQTQLADILDCTISHISHVENGARPSIDMLVLSARALNCTVDDLIGFEHKDPDPKQKLTYITRNLNDTDNMVALDLLKDILSKFDGFKNNRYH